MSVHMERNEMSKLRRSLNKIFKERRQSKKHFRSEVHGTVRVIDMGGRQHELRGQGNSPRCAGPVKNSLSLCWEGSVECKNVLHEWHEHSCWSTRRLYAISLPGKGSKVCTCAAANGYYVVVKALKIRCLIYLSCLPTTNGVSVCLTSPIISCQPWFVDYQ